jgi:predicted ATPase
MRNPSSVATAVELAAGSVLGGFRIEGVAGRGGMGVVYRATQLSLERQVALKLISPDFAHEERFRERFLREARLAASLDHPHLLPVYEAGEAEGALFLAMRLVEGASLAELLRREGGLAPERSLRLLSQLAQALEAAHAAGLLHRDVKPQNVLLAGSGKREHAYLCDFGLARRLSGGSLTQERTFLGTALYAAPEQIRGEELDGRADVYGLACLFYECLVGEPPFPGDDELALCWAHLHEPPPAPSVVDPALARFDRFFARALAKDAGERYPSASALAEAALAAHASEVASLEAPRTPASPAGLPRPLTSFLGRERELQELLALLVEDEVRLLTLTGPGGTGKTRLALRVAEEAAVTFPDGVFWVGLATLRDPSLVSETIAQTLEARESLRERIEDKRLLVLLDNFEQVVEAAPELSALLQGCPNLALLVTSRQLLRVQGECEYAVPPLAEPEAVALFSARSRLEPSEEIGDLCSRLDNLPLAVELAAARANVLSPAQMLDRLSPRLDLLKGGRDADPRQQTLRATIDWSYELLDDAEKQLFTGLAVFAGSFSLEAAEVICDVELDTLGGLVDKSLLRSTGGGRFFMLETVREYAESCFRESVMAEAARRRHAEYYLDLAIEASSKTRGPEQPVWLRRLEVEHSNLRTAIDWAHASGEHEVGLRLCAALGDLWRTHGHLREGLHRLIHALENDEDAPPRVRAAALDAAAMIAHSQGDYDSERAFAEEQLDLCERLGDEAGRARALSNLGLVAADSGEPDQGVSLLEESVRVARDAGDPWTLMVSAMNLGWVALCRGDYVTAEAMLEDALTKARESGNHDFTCYVLVNLALVHLEKANYPTARTLVAECLEASVEIESHEHAEACLDILAAITAAVGDAESAAVLLGGTDADRESLGVAREPYEQRIYDRTIATVRERLANGGVEEQLAAGRAMTFEEAVEYGRRLLQQPTA